MSDLIHSSREELPRARSTETTITIIGTRLRQKLTQLLEPKIKINDYLFHNNHKNRGKVKQGRVGENKTTG